MDSDVHLRIVDLSLDVQRATTNSGIVLQQFFVRVELP